ncbi:MAG: succinate dehydrogenase iron-sulfur subunit [Candidatus Thiodiazotropha sp. (ex. Lucinisca nassula)]|nr:succinate dehydrogenase iron-sulfur subunit [Candidatus Thiodiazotropha sp. (ex. Lucinisca nassula)]MBW9269013.1 succinate dehydrogenase iron-sulfur subunit [Candidatus Thiodiazotropha sp. (ex. Lucinisca nassula)]
MSEKIQFRIRRQDTPYSPSYWQTFQVPFREGLNVVSALMMIRQNPLTTDGMKVDPVAWEFNCMEEVCGACTMLINHRPMPACSTLVDTLQQPITLEPLSKFPVIRDLMVDRSRLFADLKRVRAWVEIDGAWDIHQGAPRISPEHWQDNYLYSRCMSCGSCLEACPQYGQTLPFVGAAALAAVRLMNNHPTGKYHRKQRLHAIMGEGGLSDCGNAQNCVQVCPKEIPLTTAIGELGRETTVQMLKDLFGSAD